MISWASVAVAFFDMDFLRMICYRRLSLGLCGDSRPRLSVERSSTPCYALVVAANSGAGRSYSHSLFGQAITGPSFRNFCTRYSLPQLVHFSGIGRCAEVNLHFG